MKQFIKINNETFEVKKVKGELYPTTNLRSLCDCYANPSNAKQEIYNGWLSWYLKNDDNYILKHFTINSFNFIMFTIACDVYDKTDKFIGKVYITKTRQEFWTI